MTRDELILRTRQLVTEGERLDRQPSLGALQVWLQLSDDLLASAWGSMDRYHLAWLMVGKPKGIVRGRAMTSDEEAAYVREVVSQKTAALRMSLDAVERQQMPFVGETGGWGSGEASSSASGTADAADAGGVPDPTAAGVIDAVDPRRLADRGGADLPPDRTGLPLDPGLAERLLEARARAEAHRDHEERRAPRPDKMQR